MKPSFPSPPRNLASGGLPFGLPPGRPYNQPWAAAELAASRSDVSYHLAVVSYPLPPCRGGPGWGVTISETLTPTPALPHKGGGRRKRISATWYHRQVPRHVHQRLPERSFPGLGLGPAPRAADLRADPRPGGGTDSLRAAALLHHREPPLRHAHRPGPAAPVRSTSEAAFLLADGMPLVWASRRLPTPLPARVAGADLVPALCERAARNGYRVFLLGGEPGVAEEAARVPARPVPLAASRRGRGAPFRGTVAGGAVRAAGPHPRRAARPAVRRLRAAQGRTVAGRKPRGAGRPRLRPDRRVAGLPGGPRPPGAFPPPAAGPRMGLPHLPRAHALGAPLPK